MIILIPLVILALFWLRRQLDFLGEMNTDLWNICRLTEDP